MEAVETLIPDNEGNHLVVVLSFYEKDQKIDTFKIPVEFVNLEIADISIQKLDLNKPLGLRAHYKLCEWLMEQFLQFPNTVFSYICSTDPLATNHHTLPPSLYRWKLFESLYSRQIARLHNLEIQSKNIIVGPDGYQTYAKVFYRPSQAPIIHLVIDHLNSKYQ